MDNKLKFHIQTAHIVNKGFSILGIIKKSFENMDEHTVPILYKTLVRPILEYGNIIWGPHYSGDKHQIRVKHRATRLVPGFDEISYEKPLRRLKLPSLQYRRKRRDMIQTYTIMRGFAESIQLSSSISCHRKSPEATALKSTNNKAGVKSGANHTAYEWRMTGITSQQMW